MNIRLILVCLFGLGLGQCGFVQAQTKDTAGWAKFNDTTLDSLIDLGLRNSPNLKAALSRVEEARLRVQIAQSYLSPSVRSAVVLSTQSLSEQRPVAIPVTADRLPRFQLNTFQVLPVDVSYELDLFHRIRNTVTVANLQVQATEADYRAFRLVLAAEIARFYWLIRANDAEQGVFRRNLLARDSTVAIIRERFRVGLINQIDVQRAETDVRSNQHYLRLPLGVYQRHSPLSHTPKFRLIWYDADRIFNNLSA
jgi:multidrug efflux system outer membrane protein